MKLDISREVTIVLGSRAGYPIRVADRKTWRRIRLERLRILTAQLSSEETTTIDSVESLIFNRGPISTC
uniref:Uncharacterized protein n=1 Tax=Caenorhabditis tropicalis TaxID=1561998 RepID=A0A1I7UJM8_9PELO